MRQITQYAFETASKRDPGPKKQILINIPWEIWEQLQDELINKRIPASRYVHAVLIDHINGE